MRVGGIDLSGSEKRPTGMAFLEGKRCLTATVFTDDEILEQCSRRKVSLIAIDAPLNFPKEGNLRLCDRILISRGLRVFPPTFGGMRKLTERGIRISSLLRSSGFNVIEVHPRTSGIVIFGTPDREKWLMRLKKAGFKISPSSDHEIDAILSALTAYLHLRGFTETVSGDGAIVVPGEASQRILLQTRCYSRKRQ
ncbi:MAG: DUF429 domain-containing protein [Candidatus Hadarchaeales archaeon]